MTTNAPPPAPSPAPDPHASHGAARAAWITGAATVAAALIAALATYCSQQGGGDGGVGGDGGSSGSTGQTTADTGRPTAPERELWSETRPLKSNATSGPLTAQWHIRVKGTPSTTGCRLRAETNIDGIAESARVYLDEVELLPAEVRAGPQEGKGAESLVTPESAYTLEGGAAGTVYWARAYARVKWPDTGVIGGKGEFVLGRRRVDRSCAVLAPGP
ncbi:hypothetical protein ACFWZ2_09715 [Streptomyces sp. NPDC059002]|uniref:hypothetical protein n=1 Tax=Streptomyces sp. NPDC059002 TaxID=3346690 RepID=UPI0036C2652D